MTQGYSENVTLHDGTTADGVENILHFEGDSLIVQRRWDAEPHMEYAKSARDQTAGKRWGDGRMGVHIPPVYFAQLLQIKDPSERKNWCKKFARENPAFVMFDRYLK